MVVISQMCNIALSSVNVKLIRSPNRHNLNYNPLKSEAGEDNPNITSWRLLLWHRRCLQLRNCIGTSVYCNLTRTVSLFIKVITLTRQVTRATHVRNRDCPRVELILKIIIILLIIFLGFIKSKPC